MSQFAQQTDSSALPEMVSGFGSHHRISLRLALGTQPLLALSFAPGILSYAFPFRLAESAPPRRVIKKTLPLLLFPHERYLPVDAVLYDLVFFHFGLEVLVCRSIRSM